MSAATRPDRWAPAAIALIAVLAIACAPAAPPSPTAAPSKPAEAKPGPTAAPAKPAEAPKPAATAAPAAKPAEKAPATETLDALYEAAKKEGTLVLYMAFSTQAKEVIPAAFEKRWPGIKLEHVDATSDKLVARAVAEARGGKTFGDIFGGTPIYLAQMREQKLLEEFSVPEAAPYPEDIKGKDWVATDLQFFVTGWNTNKVKAGEEPRSVEDLANPKWKGQLIAEPRDWQVLMGLAKKYKSEEKAVELLQRIAANNPEFHRGHSDLIELLVAGQGAVCAHTCYAHHFPPRVNKGAPIRQMMSEGVGEVGGAVAIFKGAPHPNAARLWARWVLSEEGQQVWASAGETPAHPKVEPKEKFRPETVYYLPADEQVREARRFEAKWKEIFGIR